MPFPTLDVVQVENEYGSYAGQTGHSDTEYLIHLRDLIKKEMGDEVFLASTDGNLARMVRASKVE